MTQPSRPTGAFAQALHQAAPADEAGRRWVYVPYDQLTDRVGPVAATPPGELGIVLVESPAKAARRPYHKQKLALVLANQRRFALEQAGRGVALRYLAGPDGYRAPLEAAAAELGPLAMMEPAERELREELRPLVEAGALVSVAHGGWLSTPEQFSEFCGASPPWRMDRFYRGMRKATGLLMEGARYEGGKLSFDADNRRPWKPTDPAPPVPPSFGSDPIKDEVCALIEERYADHPGTLDPSALPTTSSDAARLLEWALAECLEHFGPFEDAMTRHSRGLFHTRLSPLLNLHRLLPREVVERVAASDAPLASREGFLRQVLGWREFVRHVHRVTDGFREAPADPGESGAAGAPNVLGATRSLPDAWWGAPSGLACLDGVVEDVWAEGYSHHITRLMVLSNLATLLDVEPRALTDWFWVAYVDAYDWVVEPNVLAMGTFATGPVMTTKPYVSGAAYIDRMSDSCASCAFHPKRDCPITPLYWAFLARHSERLDGLARMAMPLRSLAKRDPEKRARDASIFEAVSRALSAGEALEPDTLEASITKS